MQLVSVCCGFPGFKKSYKFLFAARCMLINYRRKAAEFTSVIIQRLRLLLEIFCCTVDEILQPLSVTALRPKIFVKRLSMPLYALMHGFVLLEMALTENA